MPAWAALLNVESKALIDVPLPLSGLVKFMYDSDRPLELVITAPCTVFWMVPPEPAVEPSPVTVRPPLRPAGAGVVEHDAVGAAVRADVVEGQA